MKIRNSVRTAKAEVAATALITVLSFAFLLTSNHVPAGQTTPPGSAQTTNETVPVTRELLRDIAASRLLTQTVTTTNGEAVGILWDVVLNWQTGAAEFAVIQVFDNIHPNRLSVAIPWPMLRYTPKSRALQLPLSVEQLRAAPKFQAGSLPELAGEQWASQMYAYYGVQPGQGAPADAGGIRVGIGDANDSGGNQLGARPVGASVALYVAGALLAGLLIGRYLLYRRA